MQGGYEVDVDFICSLWIFAK